MNFVPCNTVMFKEITILYLIFDFSVSQALDGLWSLMKARRTSH